jgi:hypothetical protein
MATMWITPLPMVGPGGHGGSGQSIVELKGAEAANTTLAVSFTGTAGISDPLPHVANPNAARIYAVLLDEPAHIRGAATVEDLATTSNQPWPADVVHYFEPGPGLTRLSAIAMA